MSDPAKLTIDGTDQDYAVLTGSVGPDVIDIRKLYAKTGKFTYDPGFTSTAACESALTYIDGDEGVLLHRGYAIGDLAEHSTFMETSYLLLNGELPTAAELDKFTTTITRHTMVHEQLATFYRGFRRDAHPMAIMCGVVGALSAFYPDSTNIADPQERMIASHRLVAKMPTLAAMAYKYSVGQPFVYPRNDLSYTGNFLRMTFGVPAEEYEVNPVVEKAMDRIFILHADHEQNASTSTVRLAGSSGANPFACIAAGIACLWGPAHGGANEAALNMLREIGTPDKIPEYIARAKDKNDPFRLMGFGHRVYKNYDPRATVMQKTVREVFDALKVSDPVFEVALQLEELALKDDYFVEKKLFPNVDFYSGVILSAIGFPTTMFTALFALARTVGWVAQWNEMISDPEQKIGRPRQLYTRADTARLRSRGSALMRALRPALTALGAVLILMGPAVGRSGHGLGPLARVELHDRPADLGIQRGRDGRGRDRAGAGGAAAALIATRIGVQIASKFAAARTVPGTNIANRIAAPLPEPSAS